MDLEVKARWQHVVLLMAVVGFIAGSMILVIGLSDSATTQAAPWWVGAVTIGISAIVGFWGLRSLLESQARSAMLQQIDDGLFELSQSSSSRLILFNAAIAKHFGLLIAGSKRQMPSTFGKLAAAVTEQAAILSRIKPAQYEAARAALAATLARRPESISWSSTATELFPSGKRRYEAWEHLRQTAPGLPPVILNPWIENTAIYGFLAALIAIAVPIARHFDNDPATRVEPTFLNHIVGHKIALYLFQLIIATPDDPCLRYRPALHFTDTRFRQQPGCRRGGIPG